MLKDEVIKKMQEIAENCTRNEEAGCVATCPMHTNVKEYIRLLREGKGEEAIRVIKKDLFIPQTLGRICTHPYENKCKWMGNKSPMVIASLKRYIVEYYDNKGDWDLWKGQLLQNKKVAIVRANTGGIRASSI